MIETSGHLATATGRKYVLQLCKHWSHKAGTEIDEEAGAIAFENGNGVSFDVQADRLNATAYVRDGADIEHWKTVVEKHIMRFAFREETGFIWDNSAA